MKFILINIQDIKNVCELRKYNINEVHCINELVIQENKLNKILNDNGKLFHNIRLKLYERQLQKQICKSLGIKNTTSEKWYYILSKDALNKSETTKYLINRLEAVGLKRYIPVCEMNTNILKYITEYTENKKLSPYELKVLFVYKYIKNVNFDVIKRCIKEYKKVNIYLNEKPSTLVVDKISKINNEEGCSIEIIKYNKKAFLEYNVIYFADDLRTNHPRMRIDKNTLVIDEQDAKSDKYNSNIIFFNTIKENIQDVNKLNEQYGVLNIAAAVRKIVN